MGIEVSFQKTGTTQVVDLPGLYLSIYDIDAKKHSNFDSYTFRGASALYISQPNDRLQVTETTTGGSTSDYTVTSLKGGNVQNVDFNLQTLGGLTNEQVQSVATALFPAGKGSLVLDLAVSGTWDATFKAKRPMYIGGISPLISTCPPVSAPSGRRLSASLLASPATPATAPSTSSAWTSGSVHITHASGGQFDIKGYHDGVFNMHQTHGLSLNARFTYETFMLSPSKDLNSDGLRLILGSHMTMAYVTALALTGEVVLVKFGSEHPYAAHIQTEPGVDAEGHGTNSTVTWMYNGDKSLAVGNIVIEMPATTPTALVVSNGEWQYRIRSGVYLTPSSSSGSLVNHKIDVEVTCLADPLKLPVASHGLLGQGFDGQAIDGERDSYIADVNGVFETSAQGEGAIEGSVNDYLVASPSPYGTKFKFARFGVQNAPPRNMKKLVKRTTIEAY